MLILILILILITIDLKISHHDRLLFYFIITYNLVNWSMHVSVEAQVLSFKF